MSYLDQINNIQNSLFSYQEQQQQGQDDLASQAQQLLNEKVQDVAEKLEFIGSAGMAGIETLGKVKDLAQKGYGLYQKGKVVVKQAVDEIGERATGAVEDLRAGGQRLVGGIQSLAENVGLGEQTAGITRAVSQAIDTTASSATSAIGTGVETTQGAIAQADTAVSGAVSQVEGAVGGIQSGLASGLDTATGAVRQGVASVGSQFQSRLAQLNELGTQAQTTVRTGIQEAGTATRQVAQQAETSVRQVAQQADDVIDPLRGSIASYRTAPDLSQGGTAEISDPADTALTRVLGNVPTDVGRLEASMVAQRPEVQAVLQGERATAVRASSAITGAEGRGGSVQMGDAINEFLGRTAPPARASLSTATRTPLETTSASPASQASTANQPVVNQQQRANLEADPEEGVRFEEGASLDDIPEISLSENTARTALSGGATVSGGSAVSSTVGSTVETAGTTGGVSTTTTTGTGAVVEAGTTTGTTTTTTGGAIAGGGGTVGEIGEGIGSLIGDSIPVIGELALLGTALAGIFESLFNHPVETFTPQIVSAVGYDPSSLTSTFSGEGGTT